MARINIDDGVESRPEYRRLLKLVNYDDDKALGLLVRFWRLAQDYWGEHQLVPLEEIENWDFQLILDSRWGIIRENGVYAIGSEERFAWYRQKCDASKKGGRPKKEETEIEPEQTGTKPELTGVKPDETETQPRFDSVNPLVLSPVPVPVPALSQNLKTIGAQNFEKQNCSAGAEHSLTPIDQNLNLELKPGEELLPKRSKFTESTRGKMRAFVAAYSEAYKTKYDHTPEGIKQKALIGKIGHWIEHVSEVRAVSLVQVYLQISYRPFDENYHDLWQFFRHLNRIGIALDSGKNSGSTDWSKVFAGSAA